MLLVTGVPILEPMMIGMADCTSRCRLTFSNSHLVLLPKFSLPYIALHTGNSTLLDVPGSRVHSRSNSSGFLPRAVQLTRPRLYVCVCPIGMKRTQGSPYYPIE